MGFLLKTHGFEIFLDLQNPQKSHGGAWRPWATVPSPRAPSGRAPRRVRHGVRRRGRRIHRGCRWSFPWAENGWETETIDGQFMDNWWTFGCFGCFVLMGFDSLRQFEIYFMSFLPWTLGLCCPVGTSPKRCRQHFQVADAQRLIESVCGKKQLDQSMGVTKNGVISHGIYHDLPSGYD